MAMPRLLVSAAAVSRVRSPILRDRSNPTSDASVMIPKPPTWISSRMTACPNPLQYVGVSTVTNPVTHTALVAVKSAVTSGAPSGPIRDTGSISSSVPTMTAAPKAMTIT
jgi:hypothetical protein